MEVGIFVRFLNASPNGNEEIYWLYTGIGLPYFCSGYSLGSLAGAYLSVPKAGRFSFSISGGCAFFAQQLFFILVFIF